jgi:hypothetical protein
MKSRTKPWGAYTVPEDADLRKMLNKVRRAGKEPPELTNAMGMVFGLTALYVSILGIWNEFFTINLLTIIAGVLYFAALILSPIGNTVLRAATGYRLYYSLHKHPFSFKKSNPKRLSGDNRAVFLTACLLECYYYVKPTKYRGLSDVSESKEYNYMDSRVIEHLTNAGAGFGRYNGNSDELLSALKTLVRYEDQVNAYLMLGNRACITRFCTILLLAGKAVEELSHYEDGILLGSQFCESQMSTIRDRETPGIEVFSEITKLVKHVLTK